MMRIVPSTAPIGAEIQGVNIAAGVDEPTFEAVRDALHRYSVVVLRDQNMTIPQQRAFCCRFGEPEGHVTKYVVPGYKDVLLVSNVLDEKGEPVGLIDAGRVWHTDGHFDAQPTMYSMLHAIEVPHDEAGRPLGSTWFAPTAVAYDRLPEAMKARLDGLKAENAVTVVLRYFEKHGIGTKRKPLTEESRRRRAVHPVVRTHPFTGRKCIYVAEGHTDFIQGLPAEESQALIEELQARCVEDALVYKHEWRPGDLLMWDNCSTQHNAVGDYGPHQRRWMHRVSVQGQPTY